MADFQQYFLFYECSPALLLSTPFPPPPSPKTRYKPGNVNGTPASWLSWGIWLLNDRLLDRVITPSPKTKGDLSAATKGGKDGEEGGVEDGRGGRKEKQ